MTPNGSKTLQLDLFEEFKLGPRHLSRSIPLWDLMPLFMYSRQNQLPLDTPVAKLPSLTKNFEHRSDSFSLEVRPAILTKEGKPSKVMFAGEREQLVATALRALAIRREAPLGRAQSNKFGDLVTVAFTARQLQAELASTNHTFSHTEIIEALEVMASAKIKIVQERQNEKPITHSLTFYAAFAFQEDRFIVTLNQFESAQIINGAYRALDYGRMMSFEDPIARWLYNYIHTEHRGAQKPEIHKPDRGFVITLQMLIDHGLLNASREIRKLIARSRQAFEALSQKGCFNSTEKYPGYTEELEKRATKGRSALVGARWTIFLNATEVDDIIDANAEAKHRNEAFRHWSTPQRLEAGQPARERLLNKKRPAR